MPDAKPAKPSKDDLDRGGFNPRPAGTSKPKEQFGPLPTDSPRAHNGADRAREKGAPGRQQAQMTARERQNATRMPDPLGDARIEGQNPNTPERLPGHTRFYRKGAATELRWRWSSVLMMAAGLAALSALIVILAMAGKA